MVHQAQKLLVTIFTALLTCSQAAQMPPYETQDPPFSLPMVHDCFIDIVHCRFQTAFLGNARKPLDPLTCTIPGR
jgi:hypothetical protein